MRIVTLILLTAWSLSASAAPQKARVIDLASQESKIEFLAIGKPSLLKIRGTEGRAKGQLSVDAGTVSGEIVVPLEKITTGIALRDEHMKTKYLEISKFPEATLKIDGLKLAEDPFSKPTTLKDVPFAGKLKIHGEERDITGTADISSDQNHVTIVAKTKTNISAHKIELPSYLGIKVADDVEINAELKIKK